MKPIESNYRTPNVDCSLYTLPSNIVVQKYGIPRSTAIYQQHNHWTVPPMYRSIFSTYYLLKWSAEYFQEKMVDGTVEREGIIYQVIYYNCNVAAISKGVGQLLLSFRELQDEYKAQAVVLVTVA